MSKVKKVINKTACPPVYTCDACKEIVNSNCVKYTGANVTCAGITNGTTLTNIIIDLASSICELSATSTECNCTPQACVKLHKIGDYIVPGDKPVTVNYYNFFSCSATNIPAGCTRTYSIFDIDSNELFTGSITECYDYRLELEDGLTYFIREYITCADGSSESLDICFDITIDELLGYLVLLGSCSKTL
jgi:hypothetical protein